MRSLAIATMLVLGGQLVKAQQDNNCSISNVRRGTRCGQSTSVELDLTNTSNQNMRAYVYFKKPDGTWSPGQPSDLLKPRQKSNIYICAGTGEYRVKYNIGNDPKYPPREL